MSLTDILDKTFYQIHKVPAAVLHSIANVTKYGTAKLETIIGVGALATYMAGTALLLASPQSGNLEVVDKTITLCGAGVLGVLYGKEFYKNYKTTRIAQVREKGLEQQLLGNVVKYEEKLQMYRQKGGAIWYAASLPIMVGFLGLYSIAGGVQMSDPNLITMVGSAIISTNCLYGARYVLTTDYNNKKPKKRANHGEEKNGRK
jgi:hypothetical protein